MLFKESYVVETNVLYNKMLTERVVPRPSAKNSWHWII